MMIALLVAIVVGGLVGRKRGVVTSDSMINSFLVGLLVARGTFVILYFDSYREAPLSMVDIRDGGFLLLPGIGAALITALWRGWRTPALRRPLGAAILTGVGIWVGMLGAVTGMEASQPGLATESFQRLDGDFVTLANLGPEEEGKPRVVNLWATWCPPCRREMPVLQAAQARETDITFVFANQGESPGQVRDYLIGDKLELENVLLDPMSTLGQVSGSRALPTTLFYDAQGRLADYHLGELSAASLKQKLKRLN
ncbi:TlpA disulfide reductase family protein [Haliea sp. E1-2-M8]|uniref:TlpA family protein disulfide reductase n=1 Tax=Haliea sp. E1-2-M8 TaxID=3064706 RepID=UPI00271C3D53|nr:TlpA disulfide reductase family protein [Haliea sp. E1-2-M8]MDO8862019.1 TlpA disulfide reductase family protein [Haliea sp. E1-2-M8]